MKLNIGSSGRQFPGWIHLDRERVPGTTLCDIRLGLPYGDNSADVIVASHVLEHLHPFTELPSVLKELWRVLKPGGVIRIAIPDLAKLVKALLQPDTEEAKALAESQKMLGQYVGVAYEDMPPALRFSVIAFGNNSGMPYYDGHQWCGDFTSLVWFLNGAGFCDVQRVDPDVSRVPGLMSTYQDVGAAEEIVVEASK